MEVGKSEYRAALVLLGGPHEIRKIDGANGQLASTVCSGRPARTSFDAANLSRAPHAAPEALIGIPPWQSVPPCRSIPPRRQSAQPTPRAPEPHPAGSLVNAEHAFPRMPQALIEQIDVVAALGQVGD